MRINLILLMMYSWMYKRGKEFVQYVWNHDLRSSTGSGGGGIDSKWCQNYYLITIDHELEKEIKITFKILKFAQLVQLKSELLKCEVNMCTLL